MGTVDNYMTGYSVAAAGDVNGDGFADVLIGTLGASNFWIRGIADLFYGPMSGDLDTVVADARLEAEQPWDDVFAVSGAGDVDGDGYDDLLVGSTRAEARHGVAYLLNGPVTGTSNLSASTARLIGENPFDYAGWRVAAAGDVDGDGTPDILVGAPEAAGVGVAYLVNGAVSGNMGLASADARLSGEVPGSQAGTRVSSAGDLDGDGFGDVIISAPSYQLASGVAYLLHGPVSGNLDLSSADARLLGDPDAAVGSSVGTTSDMDQDGFDDIFVGARRGHYPKGAVYLIRRAVSGDVDLSTADAIIIGEGAPVWGAGYSAANAGDTNADGFPDILVGTDRWDVTYLVLGPIRGTFELANADVRFLGEAASDESGFALDSAGDTNQDGFDDVLISAHRRARDGRDDVGAAYLVLGRYF